MPSHILKHLATPRRCGIAIRCRRAGALSVRCEPPLVSSRLFRTAVVVPRLLLLPARVSLPSSPQTRFFTSNDTAAKDDLLSILQREHAEEVETNSTAMPTPLSALHQQLQQDGWKIVEDGAITKLFTTLDGGGAKVQLFFHCQDMVEIVHDDDDLGLVVGGSSSAADDDDDEAAAPVKFTVTVTKAGHTLVATCLSEEATVKIQSVAVNTDNVNDIIAHHHGSVSAVAYQGPEFDELPEDLQEAFHVYLEEHVGINQNVAAFVAMQADYREQQNYMAFLESSQHILS